MGFDGNSEGEIRRTDEKYPDTAIEMGSRTRYVSSIPRLAITPNAWTIFNH
jgi:hypothetical protein